MIVQDATRTFDYVMEADKTLPEAQRTVFKIGTLTKRQFTEAVGIVGKYKDGEAIKDIGGFLNDIGCVIKLGLRGWTNLKDSKGAEVAFDLERIDELFTPVDLQELVLQIINANTVGGRDTKNST